MGGGQGRERKRERGTEGGRETRDPMQNMTSFQLHIHLSSD